MRLRRHRARAVGDLRAPGAPIPSISPAASRTAAAGPAHPWRIPPECDQPLPPPPQSAEALGYDTDLAPVRRLVERHARRASLAAERVADLVLAASEIAANTLSHTRSGGTFQVWHDEQEIFCQAHDQGWIADPLAGCVRRGPDGRGHGLFLVNHVCDLVEMRTGQAGTTVRMHMRLGPADRLPAGTAVPGRADPRLRAGLTPLPGSAARAGLTRGPGAALTAAPALV